MHLSFFRTQSILKRTVSLQLGAENSAPCYFLLKPHILSVVVYLYYNCMLQVGAALLWFLFYLSLSTAKLRVTHKAVG